VLPAVIFSRVEIITIVVSILALLISIIDRLANDSMNKKTMAKADEAFRLAQGITEIELRNSITQARQRVETFAVDLKKFKLEHPKEKLSVYKKLFKSIIEDFLNRYDRGCMLYLDNKLDKSRFKKEYYKEIKNLVESGKYKNKYFNKKERFSSIIIVYKEWGGAEIES